MVLLGVKPRSSWLKGLALLLRVRLIGTGGIRKTIYSVVKLVCTVEGLGFCFFFLLPSFVAEGLALFLASLKCILTALAAARTSASVVSLLSLWQVRELCLVVQQG